MTTSYDEGQQDWCTFRPWRQVGESGAVRGGPCGRPATFVEYTDEGRCEHPRCTKHYQPSGRGAFKGPEDL